MTEEINVDGVIEQPSILEVGAPVAPSNTEEVVVEPEVVEQPTTLEENNQ